MRQKQAVCPNCGPTLFQAEDPLPMSERIFLSIGLGLITAATCCLAAPLTIFAYIKTIQKKEQERAVYRCSKCGTPETPSLDAASVLRR